MAEPTGDRGGLATARHPGLRRALLTPSGFPYAVALLGGSTSTVLTYLYVGAGAYELNPVLRALIAAAGLEWMVVVKTAVLVGVYWGYAWLREDVPGPVATVTAWLGALYYLGGATHDLRVALGAPFVPSVGPAEFALLAAAVAAGVALWPRWRVHALAPVGPPDERS